MFVSLALVLSITIASLGATYTARTLPPLWRFLNHFWIGAETVNAERSILYFGGQGVGTTVLSLLACTLAVIALLLLPLLRKLEQQREHTAVPHSHAPAM